MLVVIRKCMKTFPYLYTIIIAFYENAVNYKFKKVEKIKGDYVVSPFDILTGIIIFVLLLFTSKFNNSFLIALAIIFGS